MDDRDIEALLEKYRPAQPPADLRASIHQLADSAIRRSTWPWAVAAAALLAIAVAFHGHATSPTLQTPTPTASELAGALGGGPDAVAAADFILWSPLTAGRLDVHLPVTSPQ